ncbi:MAG: DEAD/DEAH box helicase [Proteobacteria bacterium]|nr:DEAD/DEAH box helicase [Pseudomonadota bacterium]
MSQSMLDAVRGECSARTWSRGVELARRGAVVLLRHDPKEALLRVQVVGRAVSPSVRLFPGDDDWSCDCRGADDPCEHVAAAVIAWRRGLDERPDEAASAPSSTAARVPARVGYRLTRERERKGSVGLGLQRVIVDAAGERPLQQALVRPSTSDGRAAIHCEIAASRADLTVELALGGPRRLSGGRLPPTTLREVLAALREGEDLTLDGQPVQIGEPRPALRALVTEEGGGWLLRIEPNPEAGEAFDNGALLDGTVLHPSSEPSLTAAELERLRKGRHLGPTEGTWLASELLPRLQAELPVQVLSPRLPRAASLPPHLQVQLTREGDTLLALSTIVYGQPPAARVINGRLVATSGANQVPLRDLEEELRLTRWLERMTPLRTGRSERFPTAAALALLPALRSARKVELVDAGEAVARWLTPTAPLLPCVRISAEGFHCDFTVTGTAPPAAAGAPGGGATVLAAAGERRVAARAVLTAWEQGQQWFALDGGGLAPLPHDWLERYGAQVAELLAARDERTEKVPPAARLELARLAAALDLVVPIELAELRARLEGTQALPALTLPADLRAELRPYQQEGVRWLTLLRDAGIGALLADDMGLGKTLQALCALRGRTLVVAPTSVLRGWAAEVARFRPRLSVSLYHGPGRRLDPSADVTLTSYALLRLDVEGLAAEQWDCLVLDEAQTVRNAESQVAQAAFRLRATWRLALTGTPVENRLEDLWSQLQLLNPGLLGGRSDFTERYARPIGEGNTAAAEGLRQRTRPFILRRRKAEVARDLPARSERVLYVQLSAEERRSYDAVLAATRQEVLQQLGQGGNVLGALAALLRLRQAACHRGLLPGLLPDGATPPSSSKLELLTETLRQALAEGHKALVFSQWTSLLDLTEPLLRAAGIDFLRLDGATRDRQAVIDGFQRAGGPPVLLISLKAGGVGVTLTAADHVFLLDPWWNPAVEDQAADRAHRIGQTRPVLIHRLVTEDTVEERVLALQQQKRGLAAAALDEGAVATALTRDELLALLD